MLSPVRCAVYHTLLLNVRWRHRIHILIMSVCSLYSISENNDWWKSLSPGIIVEERKLIKITVIPMKLAPSFSANQATLVLAEVSPLHPVYSIAQSHFLFPSKIWAPNVVSASSATGDNIPLIQLSPLFIELMKVIKPGAIVQRMWTIYSMRSHFLWKIVCFNLRRFQFHQISE